MENVASSTLEGAWQYTTDGGTNWADVSTVSNSAASVMGVDSLSKLRFVPVADFSGTPNSLGVRFLDDTYTGQFGVGVNVGTNSGSTPISGSFYSLGTSVTNINDTPTMQLASSTTQVLINSDFATDPSSASSVSYTGTNTTPSLTGDGALTLINGLDMSSSIIIDQGGAIDDFSAQFDLYVGSPTGGIAIADGLSFNYSSSAPDGSSIYLYEASTPGNGLGVRFDYFDNGNEINDPGGSNITWSCSMPEFLGAG